MVERAARNHRNFIDIYVRALKGRRRDGMSTHLNLNYHVIFSTKNRELRIADTWRERLHAFIGGELRKIEAMPLEIGGVADHVHVLFSLKATHCLATVMREIKAPSSRWIHNQDLDHDFEWQEGYGAFTVSPSMVDDVKRYIQRQPEHHRKKTFQEEYLELLDKSGTKYDPKYLW